MRLSKKGEYAVRALVEIGFESAHRPNSLIQISTVAQRTNIPEKFLEQILLALRNGGVLKSKRGVEGGSRSPRRPAKLLSGKSSGFSTGRSRRFRASASPPMSRAPVPTRNRAACASR